MTPGELRATWGLGTVFSLRMLGMFMVLPVLTTYGMALQGASEALIGIAIGIYGLAQAIFQIPFGLLSDRIGRKPLICRRTGGICRGQRHCRALPLYLGHYSGASATGVRRYCRRRHGAPV
ncbi:major facilitator family transport protein [Salmonella enterica subsp. enterica]|uniref:Major facilitator family transport protein n=1 Tax=Salmonella enterica I TaxID=59201 RepID=A0A3S4INL6_SALET|nr:major facilitator family transport protein [Salmonella enterica subsp. enterica]